MNDRLLTTLLLTGIALCWAGGCTTRTSPPDTFNPYGPLDPRTRQLGRGKFAALDLGNHWVVYATGIEPSTNWRHDLVAERDGEGRSVLTLYAQEPTLAGAAITTFIVSAVVAPPKALPWRVGDKHVRVRDANGMREVAVLPPQDAMTIGEWERLFVTPR